jgi:Na+/H+-dicarboxylate symporter
LEQPPVPMPFGVTSGQRNIIPNTLVGAFAEGNVLQVPFIAVLWGFALTWIGPRAQPLLDIIEFVSNMLFNVVAMVMWAAPLGAFGAIAFSLLVNSARARCFRLASCSAASM